MRFLTDTQCRAWAEGIVREGDGPEPRLSGESVRYGLPRGPMYYGLARSMVDWIAYRQNTLLWVTYADAWSSQNPHLYYRLRQSYHDYQLVHEAPGHLFLGHEGEDAISFLQLALLNGWDFYFLGMADYLHAYGCHDEWLEVRSPHGAGLSEVTSDASRLEMKRLPERPAERGGGAALRGARNDS